MISCFPIAPCSLLMFYGFSFSLLLACEDKYTQGQEPTLATVLLYIISEPWRTSCSSCFKGFSRAVGLVCHWSQCEPACHPAQTEEQWSGDESSRVVHNADSQGLSHNKQQQCSMDVCCGLAGLHPGASADSSSSSEVPDCAHMQEACCCS